jgi:hypothetical protein
VRQHERQHADGDVQHGDGEDEQVHLQAQPSGQRVNQPGGVGRWGAWAGAPQRLAKAPAGLSAARAARLRGTRCQLQGRATPTWCRVCTLMSGCHPGA